MALNPGVALQIDLDENGQVIALRCPHGEATDPIGSADHGFVLSGVDISRIEELSVIKTQQKGADGSLVYAYLCHHRCRYYQCP